MTLRRRVLAVCVLLAVVSCALSFGVAVVLVRHRIAAQRLAALRADASVLALVGGAPGALAAGQHVYRMGAGTPRPLRPRAAAAILAHIPAGDAEGTIAVGPRSLLYVARVSAQGRIVLVRLARLAFAEWRPFLVSLGLAALGGVLVAVVLATLLARRLTRPIDALAAATARVAAGEPEVTVPVDGEDELAGLGRAFNAMSGELGRARAGQRRFLESVSHELRTPLTAIRGWGEGLEEGVVSPAQAGRVISDEARRLERLVGDLVELGRFGREGFAVRREPVDLAVVARDAVTRHAPRAAELGIALTAEIGRADDGGPAPTIALGDADRLLQLTGNLIENALRLTPAGGRVTVTAASGRLSVSDTGPGLAQEDLDRAFERFYLSERYRSERAVGSGLGLAIVKELAERMGADVRAGSAPGGGALFTVTLPVP
ncbi:MAG TPA: HAMP domain-containing sensor histidine kinase [Solirubrobacteraceae bacterium]|nr:HAMP domain-containing sensor histidine kinase [Solirubrobacteraceae bacterium]